MPGNASRRTFLHGTGIALAGSLVARTAAADEDVEGEKDEDDEREDELEMDSPSLIAHRGFAGMYPENTVGAVRNATRGPNAADMVEIDVMATADDKVVVFHDDGLAERDGGTQGLTDVSGLVWETPWDTVKEAEVLESGELVPSLEQVMDALPGNVGVNVEFKNPGSPNTKFAANLSGADLEDQKALWEPFAENVFDVLDDYHNDVLVSSFYEGALAAVSDVAPDVPLGTLFWDDLEKGLDITRTYDCEAIHPPKNMVKGTPFFGDEYYLEGPFADVDLVSVAHEEGREVNVWTIATWYEAMQLEQAGVDGIIADYPFGDQ
ncbi:glycerophosphodiester phosphodiesterase [Haladaptatus sp. GCM10025707]|uniref:glycerophosphodiester phosphodiesterase n=1 Tax=unclassified Haladaptatus TaxID=2622732 RepID=UPI0023E7748D|nr:MULTISPECIES: glycerophosphodiester phosphodiesterase [unclassified Haladaptatus]